MLIILLRAVLLYILIIFSMRMMGKRQIGELQPSELVIAMMISNMAVLPIEDVNIPMLMGAIPIVTLVSFEIILSCLSLKFKKWRKFISGSPVVIIENGVIQQHQLEKLRFSIDDLMEGLRANQVFDVSEVYYAIVETNGDISVVKKFDYQNTTAQMMGATGTDTAPPVIVVSDGVLVQENMQEAKLEPNQVFGFLKKKHLELKDVFLLTCDDTKQFTLVKKQKKGSAQ